VAAITYHLHKLGIIRDRQNRSRNTEISSKGYRDEEAEGSALGASAFWSQVFARVDARESQAMKSLRSSVRWRANFMGSSFS